MQSLRFSSRFIAAVLALLVTGAFPLRADEQTPTPPDLTQGGVPGKDHDWNLGPTGARGWIFFRHEDLTAAARQILVTSVEAGSPADGILCTNDVILGVDGKPFSDDARKSFGRAITAAEAESGRLTLVRWRAGNRSNVELKLPVLGKYSDTAPYDCPKSRAIFEQGCRYIAQAGLPKDLNEDNFIPGDLNALALLASGKGEYRPMLAEYARAASKSLHDLWTWFYGYGNLYLAEYILATGDKDVLQGLSRTAKEVALGQSAVGTWGHSFARPDGNCNGYGCMNQPGLAVTLSLVLAREAGVKEPAVDTAIARSAKFLSYYVNKGAIPYGDHAPWPWHDDNGKCSSAAVLFDLLGDGEAARFFSRMATAAYDEREHGHCGNLWNLLWALPGVSRGGPLATGAYLTEQSWYYDLARTWKGGFVYQKIDAAEENDNYTQWDLTGAYLLSYGLPLKSLHVLGRNPSAVPALTAGEVGEIVAAGRDFYPVGDRNGYYQRKTEELLAGLRSWSPFVRKRSAQALGKREGDFVPTLLAMLAGPDCNARYGASEALGCLGERADAVAPQLRALLHDADPWIQSLACYAIVGLGKEARRASVNDLLALAVRTNPADPRGMAQRAVAAAVFDPNPDLRQPGILQHSLEGVDRQFLYPAMQSLLQNQDAAARYGLTPYLDKLTDRDLAVLLPAIGEAIERIAPSDEMFGDGIRTAGLDLLSRHHIREGMALCVSTMEPRWGNEKEVRLKSLLRYGTHAKEFLPQLRKLRKDSEGEAKTFDKYIAKIEASTNTPALISLEDFIARAGAAGAPRVELGGEVGRAATDCAARFRRPPFDSLPWLRADLSGEQASEFDEADWGHVLKRPFKDYSGDISGRFIEIMAKDSRGDMAVHPAFKGLLEAMLKEQRPGGYFCASGVIDWSKPIDFAGEGGMDKWGHMMPALWGNARLLCGLVETMRAFPGDTAIAGAARRLGDFYISVLPRFSDPQRIAEYNAAGSYAAGYVTCWFPAMEGLVKLGTLTGDRKYLDAAAAMAAFYGQFDRLPIDHAHGMLCNQVSLLLLHEATKDPAYLARVEKRWEDLVRGGYINPAGGILEKCRVKFARDEGCAIVDWFRLNLELARVTGNARYWDMAERTLHNHFLQNQSTKGGFGHRQVLCDDDGVYGFGKGIEESTWCCTYHGELGFINLRQHLLTRSGEALTCNFALAFTVSEDAGTTTSVLRPAQKAGEVLRQRVSLAGQPACVVRVRLPQWADAVSAVNDAGGTVTLEAKAGWYATAQPVSEVEFIYTGGVYAEDRRCTRLPDGPQPGKPFVLGYGPKLLAAEGRAAVTGAWPATLDGLKAQGLEPLSAALRGKDCNFIFGRLPRQAAP